MNSHKRRNEPVELTLYSNKVSPGEWKSFLTTMLKWKVPGLDFLDFTLLFPFRACEIIFVKKANTIRTFVKGERDRIKKLGPLIFPFRAMDERKNVSEIIKGKIPFGLYILRDVDMFSFMVKEQAQQIRVKVVPFFGKLFAFGSVIEDDGGKRLLILLNPEKFMEIDMEKNPSFFMELLDRPILKSVHMHSELPLFEIDEIKIGVENFDIFKHSLIAGMSGTGKSKFIEMFVKSVENKHDDTRIVVIDPHNEFSSRLKGEVIDYKGKHIEPLEIGGDASPMTTQLIVQLMISVIGEANKYSERVLFYAVYLLSEINQLSLENINLLLTDSAKRMEFASMAENDEIKRFFSVEFDDIYMHHFNSAVLPILNFISEYELYIGKKKNVVSLMDSIRNNKVTIVSFDPQFFGRRMIKFLAGAIIQQMYIFAITNKLNTKTILLIDEFPVVESLVVKNILSETRKFNLYLYLSLQYLGQIQKEILDSILTNVYNVVTFRLSKSDAGYLSSLMDLKVEEFFKRRISPSELEEEKRRIFIDLKVRECVIRLFDGDKYMIPMKVKTVDVGKWRDGTYHGHVPKKLLAQYEDAGGEIPFVPFSEKQNEERTAGKVYRMETELRMEGETQAAPASPFGGAGNGANEPAPMQEFKEKAPMEPDMPDLQKTIIEEADEPSPSAAYESPSDEGESGSYSGESSSEEGGEEEEEEEYPQPGTDEKPDEEKPSEGGESPAEEHFPDEREESEEGEEEGEPENDGMGEESENGGAEEEAEQEGESDILTKYLGRKVLREAVSRRKKASAKKAGKSAKPAKSASKPKKGASSSKKASKKGAKASASKKRAAPPKKKAPGKPAKKPAKKNPPSSKKNKGRGRK
ncbi:ATP-binding protein [Candidatus Micrarchaeota archaeon]|nr:ATP-binding protein [Candidatus Micrarchaeota archaeon]